MKKTILSSLLMLVALSIFAATPTTWTNVVSLKLIDGNNDTYTSRFGEATELTDQPSWGAAVANLEGATVRAYTVLNGENYEKLFLQSMENTALVVKTYESTSLTFELKANYGTITLFDKLTGSTKTVDKAGVAGLETDTYNCTVEANATITDRFTIFYNAATFYSVTLNEFGYATYSNDVDLALPAGLAAYKGALNATNDVLDLTALADIPANTGVILVGTAGETYFLSATTAAADASGNVLKPSAEWTSSMQNVYCLVGNELRHYVGTDPVPANKAFLQLTVSGPNPAPARISFRFGQTTAIDNVEAGAQTEKFIENGQVLIRRGNEVYNLQGQIVK